MEDKLSFYKGNLETKKHINRDVCKVIDVEGKLSPMGTVSNAIGTQILLPVLLKLEKR